MISTKKIISSSDRWVYCRKVGWAPIRTFTLLLLNCTLYKEGSVYWLSLKRNPHSIPQRCSVLILKAEGTFRKCSKKRLFFLLNESWWPRGNSIMLEVLLVNRRQQWHHTGWSLFWVGKEATSKRSSRMEDFQVFKVYRSQCALVPLFPRWINTAAHNKMVTHQRDEDSQRKEKNRSQQHGKNIVRCLYCRQTKLNKWF